MSTLANALMIGLVFASLVKIKLYKYHFYLPQLVNSSPLSKYTLLQTSLCTRFYNVMYVCSTSLYLIILKLTLFLLCTLQIIVLRHSTRNIAVGSA